jgi:predicted small secreted protein
MKNVIAHWWAAELDRTRVLGPILLVAGALILAACNNGNGGSGY